MGSQDVMMKRIPYFLSVVIKHSSHRKSMVLNRFISNGKGLIRGKSWILNTYLIRYGSIHSGRVYSISGGNIVIKGRGRKICGVGWRLSRQTPILALN
jgi:hypothetical protein